MKNIIPIQHIENPFEFFTKDWLETLEEHFLKPLDKIGFTFQSYSAAYQPDGYVSLHTLIFHQKPNLKITKQKVEQIEALLTQDDDQPKPSYNLHDGYLILNLHLLR